jgi:hypothetical protein
LKIVKWNRKKTQQLAPTLIKLYRDIKIVKMKDPPQTGTSFVFCTEDPKPPGNRISRLIFRGHGCWFAVSRHRGRCLAALASGRGRNIVRETFFAGVQLQ